jgi:hypothetical protein
MHFALRKQEKASGVDIAFIACSPLVVFAT